MVSGRGRRQDPGRLLGDPTYGEIVDVSQLPRPIMDCLRHYFLTYKALPGEAPNPILSTRFMTRWKHVASRGGAGRLCACLPD